MTNNNDFLNWVTPNWVTPINGGHDRNKRSSDGMRFSDSSKTNYRAGTKFGHYILTEKIGDGGIGSVYKATHEFLNNLVAIKLHEHFPESAFVGISFLQSASYLSQLKHPNIARLYDYGFASGHAYMAMEYINGNTLFEIMPKSNRENWAERAEEWTQKALEIFLQLLSAVRYAHNCIYLDLEGKTKRGILHGDIKPGNILIDKETGKIKLIDFMIPDVQIYLGKTREHYNLPLYHDFGDLAKNDENKSLTRTELAILSERFRTKEFISEVWGTPEYMAPEQQGGLVSVRTDIFTLGATLYEILSGYSPTFRFQRGRPRSDNPFIPIWVEEIILKSTHQDPSKRYDSVAEIEAVFRENYKLYNNTTNLSVKEWIMGDKIDVKTGEISGIEGQLYIGKFNNVITTLSNAGQKEYADALIILKQTVVASKRITDENKQEYIEVINKIGEEVAREPPNITLIKVMGEGLLNILKSEPDLAITITAVTPVMTKIQHHPSLSPLREEATMFHTSILFLAADPTNASRLRLGEEFREIHEKLKLAKLRENFKLELPQLSVRPHDITQALLDTHPKIVHFSGHGDSSGALCFENQMGQAQSVQPDALAALFEQFSNQVSCVLLNACYAEIQAKAIAKHIAYVIGMNQAISDKAAIAFAIGFYQALGAGKPIEDAYKLGCVQIRLQDIPEHLTPVLIKKE